MSSNVNVNASGRVGRDRMAFNLLADKAKLARTGAQIHMGRLRFLRRTLPHHRQFRLTYIPVLMDGIVRI
jgi:hypothetical protein